MTLPTLLHFTASTLQSFAPKLTPVLSNSAVGYQNKEITPGEWNLSCATFQPVGNKAATLGDLKPTEGFAPLEDTLQLLTGTGGTLAMYTFCDAGTAAEYESFGLKEGWYDFDEINNWDWESQAPEQKNSVSIPIGSMFILQTGYEGSGLVYSGEVLPYDKEFEIIPGEWNMLGNATPVDIKLGDIMVNEAFAPFEDTIQFLTGTGGTLAMFTYCDEGTAAEFEPLGLKAGWYDFDEINNWDWESQAPDQKNGTDIPAGYGFIVQSGYEGAGIIIPSPLAD